MKNIDMELYFEEVASTVDTALDLIENNFYDYIKRILDIILSLIGLIIGLPFVIIFSILIIIESPGSPIYKQERVGKRGKIFTIYKLRSMYCDAEKNGPKWADKNDDRVTKIGKIIRKTRIDEIPQLINVLKGEMSIVGPRPERPMFTYQFDQEIPGFINRLKVKPGLTGWAQVNGGYEMTPAEKLEYDLYYIENRCLKLDLLIILKTIGVVLTGYGAR
ncbi:exopolysaccharide biosynthesis polyprenyl glycosylphosphotransferase [Caloramator sp. Dgby_cultured_2]|uniref:exopolysaccharide biosynthesis polyprenyl glycosylphosphotransferase n=1 Tax=Caloramator sp. Dgby_cultured_2 TaxID=3029174 RepID=UPI00237DD235|nr:exopolysaccharide biosynthesis polyprenyl glycosylphosphotransferase [Caloramator sp. Dgby_cultured_2]WDU82059.1 exopolysaccharide biosynthesis polyprenyl glycosylphosphotransferase [Caloramator sp. Dgby_cultured_2]